MGSSSNSTDNGTRLHFNYTPTEWICITFITLFSISTIVHIVQAIRCRLWWLFPSTIFCGVLEISGWAAREWSSRNPLSGAPRIIQAVNLVIAPTPLVAANFILLGRIIRRLGPQYSRLTPRRYNIIFISCDIISLLVQAIGGGIASGSTYSGSQTRAHLGSDIVLGATIFQLISIVVYCALAVEFLLRFTYDQPVKRSNPVPGEVLRGTTDKRLYRMLEAMIIITVFIIIRTIYRVVEFVSGWNGKVISTQWAFNVFDGAMIVLSMYTLNVIHPGIYLPGEVYPSQKSSDTEGTVMELHQPTTGSHQGRAV